MLGKGNTLIEVVKCSVGWADLVIMVSNICSSHRYSKKTMLNILSKLLLEGIG